MHFGSVRGIRMVATATAFPRDLSADALELDNAGVLAAIGCADPGPLLERAARWGVDRRQWLERPAGPRSPFDLVDLAEAATRRALDAAGVAAADLDAVFLATSTPSRISSSAAARLAARIGTRGLTVELRGGGAGALQGLALAATSGAGRALVVAVEITSPLTDPGEPALALLYGDGAAAAVLVREPGWPGGLVGADLGTAAVPGRPFTVPGRLPPTVEDVAAGAFRLQAPDRTYQDAVAGVWDHAADHLRVLLPDGATVAPYPVTRAIGDRVAERLGVPWERLAFPLAEHGCLGAAGVLVALHAARARPGGAVGLLAVGGGVTWGALAWID